MTMRLRWLGLLAASWAACVPEPAVSAASLPAAPPQARAVSVEDAIRMVRIEDRYGTDERFAAVSPDGSRVAAVLWRGDLEQNANIYSLLVVDIEAARSAPYTVDDAVLHVPFAGDSLEQAATAIDQLTFLEDSRTVVFVGTLDGGPRQVYSVNSSTGALTALTKHASDVRAYAVSPDGTLRFFAAAEPDDGDERLDGLRRDGVFPYDRERFSAEFSFAAFAAVYEPLHRAARTGGAVQLFSVPGGPAAAPRRIRAEDMSTAGLLGSLVPAAERAARSVPALNPRRGIVVTEAVAVGIVDSVTEPPELAVHQFSTGRTTVLTNLNPALRERQHGAAEEIRFATAHNPQSTAWLVRPVGYQPGRRYPLVVLHSNVGERPGDASYLIDGRWNLTGHAAQPLAGHGFMVLFIGPPGRAGRRTEAVAMRATIEAAVRMLGRRGDIDTLRVGVSGFSRSAYYTDYLLMNSSFRFAAASQIDGGSLDYLGGMRPYTDAELGRIRSPLLAQAHGTLQFAYQAAMIDRLRHMGKPADILYFKSAPHSTMLPRHRLRSMTVHVDWWRFWLQDHVDADPARAGQYRRWRPAEAVDRG